MTLASILDLVQSQALEDAVARAEQWIETRRQGVVCFANVHVVETARRNRGLAGALSNADLVLADGAPVAWALGRFSGRPATRVTGSDFFHALCGRGKGKYRHLFIGSTPATLSRLTNEVVHRYPGIKIVGEIAPPFGSWSEDEGTRIIAEINAANPDVVWVGLGAPRQELWMQQARSSVSAPVIAGVGAVFDFVSGNRVRAPRWMQRVGLEWLHRLAHEPRRLGPRYLRTNASFVVAAVSSLFAQSRKARR